jgi:peptide/nickel transport system ATP-binding protein
VVSDVSFTVAAGQILGIVGESGSGKTLTTLAVMRMLPAAASVAGGSVRYRGQDLLAMPESEITKLRGDRLGMIFQDPLAFLNPLMTVGQQIREVLRLHGVSREQAAKRALELLKLVGVRDASRRIDDYPHQFSGGMRQRVIIAIAIANNPSLLLADEPTTALDVTVQAEILELLSKLRDELGAGLIMITHDIGVVEQICDDVAVMYAGRIVEYGRVDDVLARPRHPYTRELMRSTPRLEVPSQRRLPVIPGQPPDILRRPSGCSFHPRCSAAMDRCAAEAPDLEDMGDGARMHEVACWAARAEPTEATFTSAPSMQLGDPADGDVVLAVEDVRISYGGPRRSWRRTDPSFAVDGVTLRARAGQAVGLVGESGCGKSTLARAIVGLLPLTSGNIEITGRQWSSGNRAERARLRRTIQMVFQDPYASLNPRQSIRSILAEPLTVHRLYQRAGQARRVRELLDQVGLPQSLLDRYPYELSGGQRQRVGIARALTVEPKIIVADEPVSSLDVSVQAQIINLLADLRDELGLALLFIAHDLSVVKHLCDEVAVMRAGRIVEHGLAGDVFGSPKHPYTRTLLAAVPGASAPKRDDVGSISTSPTRGGGQ